MWEREPVWGRAPSPVQAERSSAVMLCQHLRRVPREMIYALITVSGDSSFADGVPLPFVGVLNPCARFSFTYFLREALRVRNALASLYKRLRSSPLNAAFRRIR